MWYTYSPLPQTELRTFYYRLYDPEVDYNYANKRVHVSEKGYTSIAHRNAVSGPTKEDHSISSQLVTLEI